MEGEATTLVVFTVDNDGKPRAGRFRAEDANLALKAARLLGYQTEYTDAPAVIANLSEGNVFAPASKFIRPVLPSIFVLVQPAVNPDQVPSTGREDR